MTGEEGKSYKKILLFLFFCFVGGDEGVASVGQRGGEPVVLAAFFEFETLAQLGHGGRKIAHGEVGARGALTEMAQLLLAESRDAFHFEHAARKILGPMLCGVEMAVGVQLFEAEARGDALEGTGFENGGVGLAEKFLHGACRLWCGRFFFLGGKGKRLSVVYAVDDEGLGRFGENEQQVFTLAAPLSLRCVQMRERVFPLSIISSTTRISTSERSVLAISNCMFIIPVETVALP